ncbi:MAG: GGDEF domain-containing protein, partial [Aquabacterium sp.]|uniref:GGDEF domain-containing protein n=1 Tax=Aquabacterium sp. TaxID=1872578 RepID=UPI002726634B
MQAPLISYLSALLVLVGLIIHVATLYPLRRLVSILPAGTLRNKWLAMGGLVLLFIAGYLGYIIVLWGKQTEWNELFTPGIFLFGALFVWLTISLALQTAADLKRISLLESENISDPLTKVFNRRYLDRRLEDEVARSMRYSIGLSVLMIDIDHFKRVNDSSGHVAGDQVLRHLSATMRQELRRVDTAGRLGGEEFAIILPGAALADAELFADRLRRKVAETAAMHDSRELPVTISIGVSEIR